MSDADEDVAAPRPCPVHLGVGYNCVPDLSNLEAHAADSHFDFIAIPLVHSRNRRDLLFDHSPREAPFTRSDMIFPSAKWTTTILGKVSKWLDVDSPNAIVRRNSELAFAQELAWACHLSIRAVIIPAPDEACCNLARLCHSQLLSVRYLQLWIHCMAGPIREESLEEVGGASAVPASPIPGAMHYESWSKIKNLCESSKKLGVALELPADLPEDDILRRWQGEPLRAVILNTDIFKTNEEGYPVLGARHRNYLLQLSKYVDQVIVQGVSKYEDGLVPYQFHLREMFAAMRASSQQDGFEAPYRDYLQAPLQPLADNLESQTYETFEKDPVKYKQYEEAVYLALLDRPLADGQDQTMIMVVGAGRGPLVRCALRAAVRAEREVHVYAVEKNPNAVVTLRHHKHNCWGDQVTVVSHDMRSWQAPQKADILVSELLGSWGDNELAPECLDGAQRFLKAGGISIPDNSTSYIAPMSSSKLWAEVAAQDKLKSFETAYVVKLHNFFEMSEPQECFHFDHPNYGTFHPDPKDHQPQAGLVDNNRYKKFTFHVPHACTMHGFSGYFESRLYKDVSISIYPPTFSTGMFSWFPIWFPLKSPIFVPAGTFLEAHFWRVCSGSKVWYEWAVSSPVPSALHNPGGRSSFIGL